VFDGSTLVVAIYLAGVVIGLALVDGRPAVRLGLALLWPLGPLAFVVTLAVLVGASLVPLSRLVIHDR
jgi:hypothetical protein